MSDAPGRYEHLDFNAPLSGRRADDLASALARSGPATVLDVGCGWAELLLRVVAATDGARGCGVDSDEELIERGRANARQRGLADRIELIVADGSEPVPPADVVISIGSDHAFGTQSDALRALRPLVRPGGRLLFGSGYWQRVPSAEESAVLEMTAADLPDLAGLVELGLEFGLRPLDVQTANEDEWNAFESGYLADWEEWLLRNADHPDADAVRARADAHRAGWLRGYRGVLGFGYVTFGAA